MESFNNNNTNNKRTIALGMSPLPPTSQRMERQSAQNPDIDPQKLKRTLANRRHGEVFRHKQICRRMKLEWTLKSLEADIERTSAMMYCWKRQHYLSRVENEELKQKLGFCSLEIESQQAICVELKKEKEKLKEVYVEQQQKFEKLSIHGHGPTGTSESDLQLYVGHEIKML